MIANDNSEYLVLTAEIVYPDDGVGIQTNNSDIEFNVKLPLTLPVRKVIEYKKTVGQILAYNSSADLFYDITTKCHLRLDNFSETQTVQVGTAGATVFSGTSQFYDMVNNVEHNGVFLKINNDVLMSISVPLADLPFDPSSTQKLVLYCYLSFFFKRS